MADRDFDSRTWVPETGTSTGDRRENSPDAAGFTTEQDRVFRSHFQRVNHLADRGYDQMRPAYELGYTAGANPCNEGRCFDEVETDLENGWLNVRTAGSEWQSVRVFVQAGFDSARQGTVEPYPETGLPEEDHPREDHPG